MSVSMSIRAKYRKKCLAFIHNEHKRNCKYLHYLNFTENLNIITAFLTVLKDTSMIFPPQKRFSKCKLYQILF